jgi:hypothetical protein
MKGKKPKDAAQPPAPVTEREQRAAKLPRFNGVALETSLDQMEETCSLFQTDHEDIVIKTLTNSIQGTVSADSPATRVGGQLNRALQQFSELKPESYLEAMLLAQMIQVSNAAGNCMEKAFHENQTPRGREMNASLAVKFQRTFVAQIEALQKLRGKGGQKVTVEHVHVHEGGQAIVGNVNHHTSGGRGKNER